MMVNTMAMLMTVLEGSWQALTAATLDIGAREASRFGAMRREHAYARGAFEHGDVFRDREQRVGEDDEEARGRRGSRRGGDGREQEGDDQRQEGAHRRGTADKRGGAPPASRPGQRAGRGTPKWARTLRSRPAIRGSSARTQPAPMAPALNTRPPPGRSQ